MALDKLVDSAQLDADLASVADAIRAKGGTSAQLAFPAGFVGAIEDLDDEPILDTLTATDNGNYNPPTGHAYSSVSVAIPSASGVLF